MSCETPFRLAALEAHVYRAPIEMPVQTSFGIMRSRPAVFIRAASDDGAEGWGEIWCNFPSIGAEHRARLVEATVTPLLVGKSFESPQAAFGMLSDALAVLAIQSGEAGPIAQAIAGVDIALWDMVARQAGAPLYRLFTDGQLDAVPAYASGLNPDGPETLAAKRLAEGHNAFKLKVGFGRERDLANLEAVRKTIGSDARLMVDANQGWTLDEAKMMAELLQPFDVDWLEEPLRADAPRREWLDLSQASPVPLAAGENIRGEEDFAAVTAEGALRVLQPDLGKWGGFTGCLPVARNALAAGLRFCPHWLGGGIGLVASMHLLAAAGGDGMVEVDSNPNPVRELVQPRLSVAEGKIALPSGPGLGIVPDLEALKPYRVQIEI
jgi:L-alanine-DL-glutamate epimerase-like enolase superfamily enzyme